MLKLYQLNGTPTHFFTLIALLFAELHFVILMLRDTHFFTEIIVVKTVQLVFSAMLFSAALAISVDVRFREEKKHLEQEMIRRQKLESLSLLAGGIAHDFNNILTVILGNINILQLEEDLPEKIKEGLSIIESGTKRAKKIADQLRTFAKGEVLIKKHMNIEGLLQEAVDFASKGCNCAVQIDIAKNLPNVFIDDGQISQVVHNLVINAIQAMPNGGTLTVSCRLANEQEIKKYNFENGQYIKISIKDTGVGIDLKDQDKIFSPYFTTKEHGNGLGLAISYSIIKKHDGLITFESEVGKGTEFLIFLPVSDAQDLSQNNFSDNEVKLKGTIMVMDDNEDIIHVVIGMSKKLGLDVIFAKDGKELLEKYTDCMKNKKRIELVITDLVIPGGMGGMEAFEILKTINPEVKVIVSSGYSDGPVLSNFSKYGFKGALKKPYSFQEFKDTIISVINNP